MMRISEAAALEWLEKGQRYYWEKDFESSLDCCLRAVDLNPWSLEAYLIIVYVFISNRQFLEALSSINKAEERFGDQPWLLVARGWTLKWLGLHAKALATFEKGYRMFPEISDGEILATEILLELRRFDEYDERASRLLGVFPRLAELMLSRLVRCRQRQEASDSVDLVSEFPRFCEVLMNLIERLRDEGNHDQAKKLAEQFSAGKLTPAKS